MKVKEPFQPAFDVASHSRICKFLLRPSGREQTATNGYVDGWSAAARGGGLRIGTAFVMLPRG
jgi:hypothetical protein